MSRQQLIRTTLVLSTLVLSACSGKGAITPAGDASAQITTTTTVNNPSGSAEAGSANDGTTGGTESAASCQELQERFNEFTRDGASGKLDGNAAGQRIEDLKPLLPASLADDLTTVADAFRALNQKGLIDGAAQIASKETTDALAALTDYVTTTCAASIISAAD
jgi:hypothetical protein